MTLTFCSLRSFSVWEDRPCWEGGELLLSQVPLDPHPFRLRPQSSAEGRGCF